MKFGIQKYHNISVKFDFGYDRAIFDRVMSPYTLRACSLRLYGIQPRINPHTP